jgi:hypothetical protein
MLQGIGVIQERTSTQPAAKAWNDAKEEYVPPAVEDLESGGPRIVDRDVAVLMKVR